MHEYMRSTDDRLCLKPFGLPADKVGGAALLDNPDPMDVGEGFTMVSGQYMEISTVSQQATTMSACGHRNNPAQWLVSRAGESLESQLQNTVGTWVVLLMEANVACCFAT